MLQKGLRKISRLWEKKLTQTEMSHKEAVAWFKRREYRYESLIRCLIPYVTPEATLFDIGANIGYFTILLADKIAFKGSAYLFEPIPHLADLCRKTFENSPFESTIFALGLGDKNEEMEICLATNGNIGWNTLISEMATPDMKKIPVKIKIFDSLGIDDKPDLIKVDVEGAEYRVFKGMMNSFLNWNPLPVILCEVGWGCCHPNWREELNVFKELEELGYTTCDIHGSTIDVSKLQKTTDVLFLS
jgi:FkbM family methyltransferase